MKILFILSILLTSLSLNEKIIKENSDITMIILFDNNPHNPSLKTGWGFSCLIKFEGRTILFDTGQDGEILLYNMQQLNINPKDIDTIILSHYHYDHVGGIKKFLEQNNNVTVFMPKSFPKNFQNEITALGAKVEQVEGGKKLFDNIFSTCELGTQIIEQALILDTTKGLIIITGCAHPGIVEIVKESIALTKKSPFFVLGGFHLHRFNKDKIQQIISEFQNLHVKQVGPTHCSGDLARNMFEQAFDKHYIKIGVGKIITE